MSVQKLCLFIIMLFANTHASIYHKAPYGSYLNDSLYSRPLPNKSLEADKVSDKKANPKPLLIKKENALTSQENLNTSPPQLPKANLVKKQLPRQPFMLMHLFQKVKHFAQDINNRVADIFKDLFSLSFWKNDIKNGLVDVTNHAAFFHLFELLLISIIAQIAFSFVTRGPRPPFFGSLQNNLSARNIGMGVLSIGVFYIVSHFGKVIIIPNEQSIHQYTHDMIWMVITLQLSLLFFRLLLILEVLAVKREDQIRAFKFVAFLSIVYFLYTHLSGIRALDDSLDKISHTTTELFWGIITITSILFIQRNKGLLNALLFKDHEKLSHPTVVKIEKVVSRVFPHLITAMVAIGYLGWLTENNVVFHYIIDQALITVIVLFTLNLISFLILGTYNSIKTKENQAKLLKTSHQLISVLSLISLFYISYRWIEPILKAYGYDTSDFADRIFDIFFITFLAAVASQAINRLFNHRYLKNNDPSGYFKTFVPIAKRLCHILIILTAGILIAAELGLNIFVILTSLGCVGIAVGLASQNVLKDFIAGMFLLQEDNFNIGEKITVGGITGIIEGVTLRQVHVRDAAGFLHYLPYGSLQNITNQSRDYNTARIDIPLPENFNLNKTVRILEEIGEQLKTNEKVKEDIISIPRFIGVTDFVPNHHSPRAVPVMTFFVKTVPGRSFVVAAVYREMVQITFEEMKRVL